MSSYQGRVIHRETSRAVEPRNNMHRPFSLVQDGTPASEVSQQCRESSCQCQQGNKACSIYFSVLSLWNPSFHGKFPQNRPHYTKEPGHDWIRHSRVRTIRLRMHRGLRNSWMPDLCEAPLCIVPLACHHGLNPHFCARGRARHRTMTCSSQAFPAHMHLWP